MHEGLQKAWKLFKLASAGVPAYKDYLKRSKVDLRTLKSAEDFADIPLIDKKSYINQYPLDEVLLDHAHPPMAYASSGSSGTPTFWFRGDKQEVQAGKMHYDIFKNVFGIPQQESTLVVICFSMGAWVAGNFTLYACRHVSRLGYKNLTSVTPGIEREDIFNILRTLTPNYKNLVLAGYHPFLMDIVCEAKKRGVKLPDSIYALTAGDKFSEEWRQSFLSEIGQKAPWRVVNIYGCADAGILGYETRASIALRTNAAQNTELYRSLFGLENNIPALVQYNPDQVYFESVGDELVLTAETVIPLVRYNIHDIGHVYTSSQINQMLQEHGFKSLPGLKGSNSKMNWLIKKGRTDVAVTFYALNIYPEHIQAAIDDSDLKKYLSGNYIAYSKSGREQKNERLYFEFELASNQKPSAKLSEKVCKALLVGLTKNNMEYRKLRAVLGKKAEPIVILKGGLNSSEKGNIALLQVKGKKPKMVVVTT